MLHHNHCGHSLHQMMWVDGNKMYFPLLINFSFFDEAETESIAAETLPEATPQTELQVKLVAAETDDLAGEVMVKTEEAIVVGDDKVAETEEAIMVGDEY